MSSQTESSTPSKNGHSPSCNTRRVGSTSYFQSRGGIDKHFTPPAQCTTIFTLIGIFDKIQKDTLYPDSSKEGGTDNKSPHQRDLLHLPTKHKWNIKFCFTLALPNFRHTFKHVISDVYLHKPLFPLLTNFCCKLSIFHSTPLT